MPIIGSKMKGDSMKEANTIMGNQIVELTPDYKQNDIRRRIQKENLETIAILLDSIAARKRAMKWQNLKGK
mgnify:CR=1 FL=1